MAPNLRRTCALDVTHEDLGDSPVVNRIQVEMWMVNFKPQDYSSLPGSTECIVAILGEKFVQWNSSLTRERGKAAEGVGRCHRLLLV